MKYCLFIDNKVETSTYEFYDYWTAIIMFHKTLSKCKIILALTDYKKKISI